jgi:hypothetical protein
MHAAGITVVGGPVRSLTLDQPSQAAPEEVVVDVRAAGVGNWDELVRIGSWQVSGPPPMALGVEAAGTITAVGDAVTGLAVGDAVLTHPLPLKRNGTWAQHTVAPAATVALKPPTGVCCVVPSRGVMQPRQPSGFRWRVRVRRMRPPAADWRIPRRPVRSVLAGCSVRRRARR